MKPATDAEVLERIDRYLRLKEEQETWRELAMGIWISCSDTSDPWSSSHVANSPTGYIDELQSVGQASTSPGSQVHSNDPYTTELMPVADLDPLYDAERVKLVRVFACAFDTTIAGGSGQDAAVYAEIIGSLSTDRAYMQSAVKNGQITFFQPNFFRPQIYVAKNPVLYGNTARAHISKGHQGHLSIGLPNPWWTEPNINLGKVQRNSIKVFAQMAQWMITQQKYQRYACYVAAEFLLGGTPR